MSARTDRCPACGENRTILQLREVLGAKPGEDVLEVARARMRDLEALRPPAKPRVDNIDAVSAIFGLR